MKYIVFAVCLVLCLAVESNANKRCGGKDDCEADECCVARGILGFLNWDCKKLAKEGESCSHPDDKLPFHGQKYVLFCPCTEGLSCEPTEVKDLPFIGTVKIDEKCVAGATTAPPVEETDTPAE